MCMLAVMIRPDLSNSAIDRMTYGASNSVPAVRSLSTAASLHATRNLRQTHLSEVFEPKKLVPVDMSAELTEGESIDPNQRFLRRRGGWRRIVSRVVKMAVKAVVSYYCQPCAYALTAYKALQARQKMAAAQAAKAAAQARNVRFLSHY